MADRPFETSRLQSLLSVFLLIDGVRRALSLDTEEALLYLGIGYLNTERIQQMGSHGYIAATNVSSVADFVNLPKETARRKIARLTDAGLVVNSGGIVVADVGRWFQFIEPLAARDKT